MADIQIDRSTGSGAMAETVSPGYGFELVGIYLHLSSASSTSEDFTISLDSTEGSAYDVLIYSKDMNGVQDVIWEPDRAMHFIANDELDMAWTNTDSRTWGLEIRYRRLT